MPRPNYLKRTVLSLIGESKKFLKYIEPLLFYKGCPALPIFSNESDVWTLGPKSYVAMATNLLGPTTIKITVKKSDLAPTEIDTHKMMYFANVCLYNVYIYIVCLMFI